MWLRKDTCGKIDNIHYRELYQVRAVTEEGQRDINQTLLFVSEFKDSLKMLTVNVIMRKSNVFRRKFIYFEYAY